MSARNRDEQGGSHRADTIKARYSKHYRISEEELAWLGERVETLATIVEMICHERINELEETARAAG